MSAVKFCNPPAYDEIGVKALYEWVIKEPHMADYFPDKFPKGRQCDKSYMYNIWNTIQPEQVEAVLAQSNQVRHSLTAEKVRESAIIITDEWEEELKAMPFISKEKGRMSHLLKQKSKIITEHKPRVKYSAHDFRYKPRDLPEEKKKEGKKP